MLRPGLILGVLNWSLVFVAIFLYALIFLMVYRSRRELKDISLLLTCNTCLAALLTCLTVSVMISSNLFWPFLLVDMKFCFAWGLFYDIFECSIYHSYCLQAFYRLCRVVFYKKRFLLSYNLYLILIVVQWSWILALLIPPVFVNWYARLPTENYCLVPYTYIVAEVYHILVLYLIPLVCIGVNLSLDHEFHASNQSGLDFSHRCCSTSTQSTRFNGDQTNHHAGVDLSDSTFPDDYLSGLRTVQRRFISVDLRGCWSDYLGLFDLYWNHHDLHHHTIEKSNGRNSSSSTAATTIESKQDPFNASIRAKPRPMQ